MFSCKFAAYFQNTSERLLMFPCEGFPWDSLSLSFHKELKLLKSALTNFIFNKGIYCTLSKIFSKNFSEFETCRSPMFFKVNVLKNFAIFTGKPLCWSLFRIKLRAFRPAIYQKESLAQLFSCVYCKLFKHSFFYRTPGGCFWKWGKWIHRGMIVMCCYCLLTDILVDLYLLDPHKITVVFLSVCLSVYSSVCPSSVRRFSQKKLNIFFWLFSRW